MSPHGLRPALRFRGLRFARTAGEAFRDASYAQAFEHHLAPSLWHRIRLFFRRRFA